MPHFHFHLTTSLETSDDEGVNLDGVAKARCYAVKMIGEVLCNSPEEYWEAEVYRVTVTDARRLILFTVEMISTDAAAISNKR
jgi:hypothetical protein